MNFNTPILLITWKRHKKLSKVIDSLRKIKAQKIYVACDGANKNNIEEELQVFETRKVIENEINWEYKYLKKLFSNNNYGCMNGVSKAINWFFKNEKEGIILEEDCLPHPDFFQFAEELLEKYRFDKRIWSISGTNFQKGKWVGKYSYYFSLYPQIWGWATWRRCWKEYDVNMKSWPEFRNSKILNSIFENNHTVNFWEKRFDKMYHFKEPDTWDFQWLYCVLRNSGLNIIPNMNMVENIGFGPDATHTKGQLDINLKIQNFEPKSTNVIPIKHPNYIVRSQKADNYTNNNHFAGPSKKSPYFFIFYTRKVLIKIMIIIKNLFSKKD